MYINMLFSSTLLGLLATIAAAQDVDVGAASAFTQKSPLLNTAQPLPLFNLPNAFPGSDFVSDPNDIEAIRQTMSHYPLAIDGKNFAALSLVFASNAVANYSTPLDVLTPLSTIKAVLALGLSNVTTQHSLGTQVIDIVDFNTAVSVTYYTATHFGMGTLTGQIVTAYGQYQDVWTRQPDTTWLITHRNAVFMGPLIGNTNIFIEQ